ncbi:MAG: SrfA family protein [Roseicyclus sp.]
MRHGVVLSEASSGHFEPLGAFGQPVHQNYVQLRAAILARLGPRYADFFARPQTDEHGGRIRWIAPVAGDVRHWRELAPEEQAARALDLQVMRGRFHAYLAELRTGGEGGATAGGEAFAAVLDQALKTPDDGHLHFVDDQPVASFWGFRHVDQVPFETLSAAPPAMPAAAGAQPVAEGPPSVPEDEAPVTEPRRGWPWWWWLLLLLLLLLLLWLLANLWRPNLLLPSLRAPWLPEITTPAVPDPAAPLGEVVPERVIVGPDGSVTGPDGVVVGPNGDVLGPTGEGPPAMGGEAVPEPLPEDPAMPGEPPADAVPPELAEPPAESESEQPESMIPPEVEPTPSEAEPAPPEARSEPAAPEAVPPGAPIAIPDAVASGGDGPAGFAQGRWRSRSGLVDDQGGAIEQVYELDAGGQGRSIVRRSDGVECTAPAEAMMQDGRLEVRELENLRCGDGSVYERSRTVCERGAEGRTTCRGVNADGSTYGVQIERAQP